MVSPQDESFMRLAILQAQKAPACNEVPGGVGLFFFGSLGAFWVFGSPFVGLRAFCLSGLLALCAVGVFGLPCFCVVFGVFLLC